MSEEKLIYQDHECNEDCYDRHLRADLEDMGYMHRHNEALPRLSGWVTHPSRHLWGRCDDCGKRRLFLRLYDCYPPIGEEHGFWWVCADCLIEDVSEIATELMNANSNH